MFLVMAGAALSTSFSGDKQTRGIGISTSIIFLTFGIGGMLWPILRKREPKAIHTEYVHLFDMHCEAILFPMSRVKQFVTLGGAIVLLVGIGTLLFFADDNESRAKGVIALVFYVCVLIVGLRSLLGVKKGLFLVSSGIIWNEMFRAPCFIPWEIISQSALFLKKEKNLLRPIWTFGLNVSEPALFRTSKWSRKKFLESKIRNGWYFYFFQETIIFPLEAVAKTVQFYCLHPESRNEIGTTNSLTRIHAFEETAI